MSESDLDLKIEDISFSNPGVDARIRNVLQRNGILTLGNLVDMREDELAGLRNLGAISVAEIKVKLDSMGLKLKQRGHW